jgi:hypothetical protein
MVPGAGVLHRGIWHLAPWHLATKFGEISGNSSH